MGCLLLLNDDERKPYWRSNIFKLEKIIIFESILSFILIIISAIIFPYNSFNNKTIKKQAEPNILLLILFIASLIVLITSFLIKYIHTNKTIRPNYRLCIMHFLSVLNLFFIFLCLILSFCITAVIHRWANIYEFIPSKNNGEIIYIYILYNIIILLISSELIDFLVESFNISKVAKFLSEGNNINNQKLLLELFKISFNSYQNSDEIKEKYNLDTKTKYNENKTFKKLRIIFPKENKEEETNTFENSINKFREVEIIQKIEYKSTGIQTDEGVYKNYYKKYKNENDINTAEGKSIEEDLSKNVILVKNSNLISSFNSNE